MNTYITTEDKEVIEKLRKSVRGKRLFYIFTLLILGFKGGSKILNSNFQFEKINFEVIFNIILLAIILIIVPLSIIELIKTLLCKPLSQYGTVGRKYTSKYTTENHKKYYIDIVFNDSMSIISKVLCDDELYSELIEGDRILAVSFDKKNTHAIRSNRVIQW